MDVRESDGRAARHADGSRRDHAEIITRSHRNYAEIITRLSPRYHEAGVLAIQAPPPGVSTRSILLTECNVASAVTPAVTPTGAAARRQHALDFFELSRTKGEETFGDSADNLTGVVAVIRA